LILLNYSLILLMLILLCSLLMLLLIDVCCVILLLTVFIVVVVVIIVDIDVVWHWYYITCSIVTFSDGIVTICDDLIRCCIPGILLHSIIPVWCIPLILMMIRYLLLLLLHSHSLFLLQ
jgi:hypothetical protein